MVPRRCIVALTAWGLLPAIAQADIIIDDFDVPAFHMPNEGAPGYQHSEPVPVGELNLFRTLQFSELGADPIGEFDSAISAPSQLTATLVEANAVDDPFVQIDQRLLYARDFSHNSIGTIPFDISEGGRNNALALDFLRLEGTRPPDRLIVWLGTFVYRHFDLPLSSEPFSLVIPFSDFRRRGGGSPPPVPFNIGTVEINFQSGRFAESYELALDRIRVTSVVPEPGTGSMLLAVLILTLPLLLKGGAAPVRKQ